jgi:hypothetical protein
MDLFEFVFICVKYRSNVLFVLFVFSGYSLCVLFLWHDYLVWIRVVSFVLNKSVIKKYLGDINDYKKVEYKGRHFLLYVRSGALWKNNIVRLKMTYTPLNQKQRKKWKSNELIPYENEAKEHLYQAKVRAFRRHNPQLYKALVGN